MTTAAIELAALHAACAQIDLDATAARPISRHATSVYRINDRIVGRINRNPDDQRRAHTALAVTRWLLTLGFPATAPLDVEQPITIDGLQITFWRYYPQNNRPAPGAGALGALLRQLHQLPSPPVELPHYEPLSRLGHALNATTSLAAHDREWLSDRRQQLLAAYNDIDSELGVGFVHGDAYPGNTLWGDDNTVLLGDWDEVAIAPRELDLINTHQGARVGRSQAERAAFTEAYGWDVTRWSGYTALREMRDLHTLGAFIQRADAGDRTAHLELQHRIATLRAGDQAARWHIC